MENLLDKVYNQVICTEPEYTELGLKFDAEVEKLIEPLEQTMSKKEIENIRSMIHDAAYLVSA